MADEIPNLVASARVRDSKGAARLARRDNMVPGVFTVAVLIRWQSRFHSMN